MDNKYMLMAVDEAKKAFEIGEIPVGCVIVKDDVVIGTGFNLREKNNNMFGHAEIIAINNACEYLKNWRLDGCDIYITLEPCNMCRTIIEESRIDNVYYCIKKDKNAINKTIYSVCSCGYDEISELMKKFFNNLRK